MNINQELKGSLLRLLRVMRSLGPHHYEDEWDRAINHARECMAKAKLGEQVKAQGDERCGE